MRIAAAVVAALALACSGNPAPVDPACPTPVTFGPMAYDCRPDSHCPAGTHATCSPADRSWNTYDPPALHCEWHCVQYECAAVLQDVSVALDLDGTVLSFAQADAQGCL
jgi:hypothetical protein